MVPTTKWRILTLTSLFAVAVLLLWADSGANHQIEQSPPIQMGTTGGNINDISSAFCCSGTLGSLITVGGVDHILSNNHVLARTNKAEIGEPILHPGLIDQNPVCAQDSNDAVAALSDFVPISFKKGTVNKVDAAIAEPSVSISSDLLDIGPVGDQTVTATLELAVQKSGRTTGHTHGTVTIVNATLDVAYSKKCGTGLQIARFIEQIGIGPGDFSAGGDSGSLIVEDGATTPGPVGLLFAGSSTTTFANPIDAVLSSFPTSGEGGGGEEGGGGGPPPGKGKKKSSVSEQAVAMASLIKQRHEARLFAIPGVVGVGVGFNARRDAAAIVVMLRAESAEARRAIPVALEGVAVRIEVTGDIVAFAQPCPSP